MKLLRVLLALLTFAQSLIPLAPARAATDPPAAGMPYQQFRAPRSKRIAVIMPQRWDVLSASNRNSIQLNMTLNLQGILDMFENQGGEVHWYKTTFFESDADHKEMWTDLGAKYSAAIVLWPHSLTSAFNRYLCADSTNAQLIVVGGADNGALTTWADTTLRWAMDWRAGNQYGSSHLKGAAYVTYNDANRDTLWFMRAPMGVRRGLLPTGIDSVVRVLRPITTSGTSFMPSADSNSIRPPGSWNTAYGANWDSASVAATRYARALMATNADSVAGPGEQLGVMWRVKYTKYSGEGVSTWINSLATSSNRGANDGGLSPRSVYFLKASPSPPAGEEITHLLWGLLARFTTVKPIKYAYDWDDLTDLFTDNLVDPRWTNAQALTYIDSLAKYGMFPAGTINPRHGAQYLQAQNPDYEIAWSGSAHSYLKRLPWVHHAHDSTASHISSNLVGAYGGYTPGNGATLSQGGTAIQKYAHRYASRWNPGANEAGFIGAGGNFGIVQRLAYSDSVRRVHCPECIVPPFLNFPNNQMLPVGWRARPTTSNPLWTLWYSASAECPIDSLLWAFDYGLNHQQTSGKGKIFLRMQQATPWTSHVDMDRDSMVAFTWFAQPGERFTVRIGDRVVESVAIGSFLQGGAARSDYMQGAGGRTGLLLGLRGGNIRAEQARTDLGETHVSANGGQNGAARPGTGNVHSTILPARAAQTTRVVYQHPLRAVTPGYDVDAFLRSIAMQVRALSTIAGRPATRCVYAWQVFEKD